MVDVSETIQELKRARQRIEDIGLEKAKKTHDFYSELSETMDEYREDAVGTGDFETYVEFQGILDDMLERVKKNQDEIHRPEDFERVIDDFEKRVIRESDFRHAESTLSDVRELSETIDRINEIEKELRYEKGKLERRKSELESRLKSIKRKIDTAKGVSDIDPSPLVSLIESYNSSVETDFEEFYNNAPAIKVARIGEKARDFPLADIKPLDKETVRILERTGMGRKTVSEVLEYADYSDSKLSHYIDKPEEFRRNVSQTWFKLLSADDFKISVETPQNLIKHKVPELVRVVGEFGSDETVRKLREIHSIAERGEYAPMRRAYLSEKETGDKNLEDLQEEKEDIESEIGEIKSKIDEIESASSYFIE
ncbi:MAG: hypothetical protein SV377_05240 [Halobacteria archaeon]|nr:hypothetical protein [Halobacteria archaeon]